MLVLVEKRKGKQKPYQCLANPFVPLVMPLWKPFVWYSCPFFSFPFTTISLWWCPFDSPSIRALIRFAIALTRPAPLPDPSSASIKLNYEKKQTQRQSINVSWERYTTCTILNFILIYLHSSQVTFPWLIVPSISLISGDVCKQIHRRRLLFPFQSFDSIERTCKLTPATPLDKTPKLQRIGWL